MLERQRLHLKYGILVMTLFQLIVGDPRAEVMDMMKTYISREPLQDLRKFIERTTIQAGVEELPIRVTLPISGVKVMLNIEQPHAHPTSDKQNRDFHQQEGRPANLYH